MIKKQNSFSVVGYFKNFLQLGAESLISDFFFILLPRESDGGAIHKTNSDSLFNCFCFRVFQLSFASHFFYLLFVRFNQAGYFS